MMALEHGGYTQIFSMTQSNSAFLNITLFLQSKRAVVRVEVKVLGCLPVICLENPYRVVCPSNKGLLNFFAALNICTNQCIMNEIIIMTLLKKKLFIMWSENITNARVIEQLNLCCKRLPVFKHFSVM